MKEYIERKALFKDISENVLFSVKSSQTVLSPEMRGARKIINRIESAPIIDAVEVVRCMDCGYWGGYKFGNVCKRLSGLNTKVCTTSTDFCSYGIKKAGDT